MSDDEDDTEDGTNGSYWRRWTQRLKHFGGPSMFDNREATEHEIFNALSDLALNHDLSPEEQAFVGGLCKALYGRAPFHHVRVVKAVPGGKIRFAAKIDRSHGSLDMADAIDIAVAGGAKLEAEVQGAADQLNLSRREVFRRLKEIRSQRLKWGEPMANGRHDPTCHMYIPAGFAVDAEGKLVIAPPSSANE